MLRATYVTTLFSFLLLAGCTADAGEPGSGGDLGTIPATTGKADSPVVIEVPFAVPAADGEDTPGQTAGKWSLRTCGRLAITTHQDPEQSWERLQLVTTRVHDGRVRRSWRGRAPYVRLPASETGEGCVDYELHMLNWGSVTGHGYLRIETEPPPEPGIDVVFNSPDGSLDGDCIDQAVVDWLNNPETGEEALVEEGVHPFSASNIITARNGPDGIPGTDDDGFDDIEEVDDVYWVGEQAMKDLRTAVRPRCEGDGGMRERIVDVVQSARESIDLAIYGLKDERIEAALCDAAESGVDVRVVTDEVSEDPDNSRSYWPALFGPDGLAGCGARVEAVRSYGTMHHKFLIVDRGTPQAVLVTGSTNFTASGLDQNHNHVVFARGAPELNDAYHEEMQQLLRHCATDRLDDASCDECTPGCTEDRSPEGPWALGDAQVQAFFAPADDPLRALRGKVVSKRLDAPDPACNGPDAECNCRQSGSRWACDYCARGEDGWGLVGEAEDRVLMSMYSATDQCFALGLARAKHRGVDVVTVWDFVRSGSPWERDDFLCAEGVPTYVSNWGGGSAQVRNHNKTVVVDDAVFDGSMNLSASGAAENNENTLLVEDAALADTFARYIRDEVRLLESRGVTPRTPDECRCTDLVDNDGDGRADADDPDCDAG
ncbi:MAG: phospholipase D-like domain-containing protein [Polyangiales bacterium]